MDAENEQIINNSMISNTQVDPTYDDTLLYVNPHTVSPYKFMDDAYYGEAGFGDGTYLSPHLREMFYNARRQISTYKNFVKPILNAMLDPVFADVVSRKVDTASLFSSFIEDTDNNGTNLDQALQETLCTVNRHGQAFIVMDNFRADDMPETMMAARQDRIYPYIMIKNALDVDSSILDKWGNIRSITFIDIKVSSNKKQIQTYRTWTSEYSQVVTKTRDSYTAYAPPIVHGLGVIPVIPVYKSVRRDKTKLCVSPPHYDISRIALAIYNKESEVRDLERSQSFSLLCIQSDRGGNISIGNKNVLYISNETTNMPTFISPNPSILIGLMINAEKMRDDMYKLAEQSGVTAVKSEASGVAEAYKFYGHETVLQKASALAKKVDYAIFDLFCLYTGETLDYEADFPTDFAPGNITIEVDTLDKYLKLALPPLANALALQKWTRLILSDQDPEDLEAAIEEIERIGEEKSTASIIEPTDMMGGDTGMQMVDIGMEGATGMLSTEPSTVTE